MKVRQDATRQPWGPFKSENPYLERWPLTWEEELLKAPALKPFRSAHQLVDHLFEDGNRIFKDTNRSDTWMLYQDHLKIFWEKDTLDYIKSLPCPTADNPNRTWYDRIKGKNNDLVNRRYENCLPGDSPELMPLDCHLFSDIQEGLARNIALSHWMAADNPLKYDGSTPHKIYRSICRTLETNCPVAERIVEDIDRIKDETLQRIVDANGTYIEDSTGKGTRHGVRLDAQQEAEERKKERNVIKADPAIVKSFDDMFKNLQNGTLVGGILVIFDLTGDDDAVEEVDIGGEDEWVSTRRGDTEEEQ
jgi:hypothetical protein